MHLSFAIHIQQAVHAHEHTRLYGTGLPVRKRHIQRRRKCQNGRHRRRRRQLSKRIHPPTKTQHAILYTPFTLSVLPFGGRECRSRAALPVLRDSHHTDCTIIALHHCSALPPNPLPPLSLALSLALITSQVPSWIDFSDTESLSSVWINTVISQLWLVLHYHSASSSPLPHSCRHTRRAVAMVTTFFLDAAMPLRTRTRTRTRTRARAILALTVHCLPLS